VQQTGIEPMPSGFIPTLSMSYMLRLHSAEHETGYRPAPVGITGARTQGLAKDRANKPSILRLQAGFEFFLIQMACCVALVTVNIIDPLASGEFIRM
jgi:hypothetical protein